MRFGILYVGKTVKHGRSETKFRKGYDTVYGETCSCTTLNPAKIDPSMILDVHPYRSGEVLGQVSQSMEGRGGVKKRTQVIASGTSSLSVSYISHCAACSGSNNRYSIQLVKSCILVNHVYTARSGCVLCIC